MTTIAKLGRLALAAALGGCVGGLGDGPTRPVGGGPTGPRGEGVSSFWCEEGAAPDDLPMRRLSHEEYRRTLRDVLVAMTDEATGQGAYDDVETRLERIPGDSRDQLVGPSEHPTEARYVRLVQTVSQAQIEGQYEVALAAGAALTASDARLEALMGPCATDADPDNDPSCLDAFVDRAAPLAFRAPLDPDERAFLRDVAYIDGDVVDREGVGELVAVLLMSPRFLYRFELGVPDATGRTVALSDHELASKLAYHFWGTMPDDALRAAAEAGELSTEAGYARQLERVISDPRTRETTATFFAEWIGAAELERLDEGVGDPVFDAFFDAHPPSEALHDDMLAELAAFSAHTVFDDGGGLPELLLSTAAFPHTDELAALYGVARWAPGEAPVALPASERAGLLTRPAFLANASVNPHPITRGVAIRRHVICDDLPEPPGDIVIPEIDPRMSSREFTEEVTAPDACQSCHAGINALGFALGHYDALGRYIEAERLFDEDGGLLEEAAVDAAGAPRISGDDDRTSDGPLELSALLADSPKVEACVTRHYFRFAHRRVEEVGRDGCALEGMRQALADGGTFLDLLRAAALAPEFRTRRMPEGE